MTANVLLNPGYGGSVIRTIDQNNTQTQVVQMTFGGDTGTEQLATVAKPFPIWDSVYNSGRGAIPGYLNQRRFGYNSAVGTSDSFISNIGGSKPWQPTTASKVEAISASANDTAAGSGAQAITIEGLDSNFDFASETLVMNGQSATASSVNSYIRITRSVVSVMGTYAGTNAGAITVRVAGAGTNILSLTAGISGSRNCHLCVPRGYTFLLTDLHMSADPGKATTFRLWLTANINTSTAATRNIIEFDNITSPIDIHYGNAPIGQSAYTDLYFTGVVAGATNAASAEIVGVFVPN